VKLKLDGKDAAGTTVRRLLGMPEMEPFNPTADGCRQLLERANILYRRTSLPALCRQTKKATTAPAAADQEWFEEMSRYSRELCTQYGLS
jgi:hypothetical protein